MAGNGGYEVPNIDNLPWVERGILTDAEVRQQMLIKVEMPGSPGDPATKNLGECAVLACAEARRMIAVIDDADARGQARARNLRFETTMGITVKAFLKLDDVDRDGAEALYEALLATGMRLPTVESVIGWGYAMGLLPGAG